MMYKFNNNLLPNGLSQLHEKTDSVHDHNTRGCQLFRVPTGTKTLSNMSARVWNALSNKIDSNTSRAVFKRTDQAGTFMSLKCVVYYANYRSGHQSSKIQVVP